MRHSIDTAPRDGTEVLVVARIVVTFDLKNRRRVVRRAKYSTFDGYWRSAESRGEDWVSLDPALWMPIPEIPEE